MAIAPVMGKNLWIAASDGDVERVRYLIEVEGMSPNAPDANTYTPMYVARSACSGWYHDSSRLSVGRHAAASYAHLELLEYLISKGGDINVTDEDGDTPLFTVEAEGTARWLVEHGARVDVRNHEGLTAAEHLFEDHPEAAVYLQSILNASTGGPSLPNATTAQITDTSSIEEDDPPPANQQVDSLSSALTADMLARTEAIMRAAEAEGTDPDERLREMVGEAVRRGQGRVGEQREGQRPEEAARQEGDPASKRSRAE